MAGRRQLLVVLAGALCAAPVVAWLISSSSQAVSSKVFPFQQSDDEWARQLTEQQYRVLRRHATERPFSSPLNDEKRDGTFVCAGCGHPLFAAHTKYDSGTGWPSFWQPLRQAIGTSVDRSLLMIRTEVHCARCGGHLGHVFNDGPEPSGLRYCINGAALKFVPREEGL